MAASLKSGTISLNRWLPVILRVSGLLLFIVLSGHLAVTISQEAKARGAGTRPVWFVLEGKLGTLPALAKGTMLIQRLPAVTVKNIEEFQVLLSTIGNVYNVTYQFKLFNSHYEEIFSTTVNGREISANSYNRIPMNGGITRPLRNEKMYMVLFSDNASDKHALTAYYTLDYPKGTFFVVPWDGSSSIPDILKSLKKAPENWKFHGSINLNIFGK